MTSTDAARLELDIAVLSAYWAQGRDALSLSLAHFGVLGHPREQEFAQLLGALHARQIDLTRDLILSLGLAGDLLQPLDRVVQFMYKVLTGIPLGASIDVSQSLVAEVLRTHPGNPDAEHLALEFMLYFGLLESAGQLLDLLPRDRHMPHRAMWRRAKSRLENFTPRTRFSYCILTWNRADLLDRCLTDLRLKTNSQDYEIIVGVNASTDHTADVLARHGIEHVHWNVRNDSIDYYREIMDAASGEYLVEIDDNVVEFPTGFDDILVNHFQAFPEYAYLGFEPTRLSLATGETAAMSVGDESYTPLQSEGLKLFHGPVWGCCAMIRNQDYRRINGLYGVRLSKQVGEEPQFIRKLVVHQKKSGLLKGYRLLKAYP